MNNLQRIGNSAIRFIMVHGFAITLGQYIVNEFPKSGGTWLGQMLGAALNLPFPRNTWPKFGPCIIHGHHLSCFGMRNVVVMWRDGRDVMVSWYHHCLFPNERGNHRLVRKTRQAFDPKSPEDVRNNLPDFIEYAFERQRHFNFTWAEFVRAWHWKEDVIKTSYEALRNNTSEELDRVILELTGMKIPKENINHIVETFSFARQAGRNNGLENKRSFMRKGIIGDWKNVFNRKARETFDYYAGKELIALGYEKNHSWVVNADKMQLEIT